MIFNILFAAIITNALLTMALPISQYSNIALSKNNNISAISLAKIIDNQNMVFTSDRLIKVRLVDESVSEKEYESEDDIYRSYVDPAELVQNMEFDYTNIYDNLMLEEGNAEYDETRDPQSYAFHFRQFLKQDV